MHHRGAVTWGGDMVRRVWVTCAVACVGGVLALAAPSVGWAQARIPSRGFQEVLRPAVPHAGQRDLGVVSASTGAGDYSTIYIRLPKALDSDICVHVISIDGRYTASAQYRVTASPGDLPLSFPTQRLGRGANYDGSELAVDARVGPTCTGMGQPALIATWAPAPEAGRIGFAVNAGAGASAFTVDRGTRVDCEVLAETRPTRDSAAMTHLCWVSPQRLASGQNIRVFRETSAGRDGEIIFPLYGAPPPAAAPR